MEPGRLETRISYPHPQTCPLSLLPANRFSVRDNLLVDNPEEVIEELKLFKKAGGGTICDISPKAVRVKPECLPEISMATGLHIVAGTSFYVDALESEASRKMGVREKAEVMVREITGGGGGGGGGEMKCGLIGEIGCSWPLLASERATLQAAALAQKQTGEWVGGTCRVNPAIRKYTLKMGRYYNTTMYHYWVMSVQ